MRVTLDTGVFPIDDLRADLKRKGWTTNVVSVTDREFEGTSFAGASVDQSVTEIGVWDESRWDQAAWGSKSDAAKLERILHIIANGSFPRNRDSLTLGQRRQLRDAMVFESHLRSGADLFVTRDERAFVRDGRRDRLQTEFNTRILTRAEFADLCSQ
jgi:hypothetical protein